MTISGAIIIFLVWWWIAFLAVLPVGVKGRWESDDDGVKGAEPGAPTAPELKRKLKLATLITLILWVLTVGVILSGVINFRQ